MSGTSTTSPSRTTAVVGAWSTARRSSVRLARTSWAMPMTELITSTTANRASPTRPVISTATASTLSSALKRVRTLARTISPTVREVLVSTAFVRPSASRARTSSALSPTATSVTVSRPGAGRAA